jgi:hypothetical protein
VLGLWNQTIKSRKTVRLDLIRFDDLGYRPFFFLGRWKGDTTQICLFLFEKGGLLKRHFHRIWRIWTSFIGKIRICVASLSPRVDDFLSGRQTSGACRRISVQRTSGGEKRYVTYSKVQCTFPLPARTRNLCGPRDFQFVHQKTRISNAKTVSLL